MTQKFTAQQYSLGLKDTGFATPVECHSDLWHPLETVLTNRLHMVQIEKITVADIY
jgi:hypothetical protein